MHALYEKKIFGFEQVQDIVNEYYKNPESVLKKLGIEWKKILITELDISLLGIIIISLSKLFIFVVLNPIL